MRSGRIKNICLPIIILGLALVCSSCGMSISLWNPYTITSSYIMVGNSESDYKLAGAYIDVLNNTEKEIKSGELVFHIFDSTGNVVSRAPDKITSKVDLNLLPGEEIEVIISLDKFLGSQLDGSYKLDYVYFSKLNFADGTFWCDPLGVIAK